jgi:glycosyltransferase involved in cell wall biosynthesis
MPTWIKQLLLDVYKLITSRKYRILRRSKLFDPRYYLEKYPDVKQSGANPILHYLDFGFAELRQPSAFFDPVYYLMQVPELRGKAEDPLSHYLERGFREGLRPNPLFDPKQYRDAFLRRKRAGTNPYLHFLKSGRRSRTLPSPCPYFDPGFYLSLHPEVRKAGRNPCFHYLDSGIDRGLQPSLWFDAAWYQDRYNLDTSPLTHYLVSGFRQGNPPVPVFDPEFYASQYGIPQAIDPFLHYLREGMRLDHRPTSWFDPAFYRSQYLEGEKAGLSPLGHFLTTGLKEGHYPNRRLHGLSGKPTVSILVPVYNVAPRLLNNCIRSVLYQSYPHWELCLADDCSTREEIRPLIESWCAEDDRIKAIYLEKNAGISHATNMAATLATGEYLGFLDNDDELAPHALASVAESLDRTGGDLFYSDEDLIGASAARHSVFRKPDFNRELLFSHNYITHFVVTKRHLFEEAGGCDPAFNGAQDLDLFLRLSEKAGAIIHIPDILYHWRATDSSTSINHSRKNYADEAGRTAVEAALQRRKINASVNLTPLKFYYRVKRRIPDHLPVTLVIYFECAGNDPVAWLSRLLELSNGRIGAVVAMCSGLTQYEALCAFARDRGTAPRVTVRSCGKNGFAHGLSEGSRKVSTEYLAFLSDRVKVVNRDWLDSLIEYGQSDDVGMVGGRISCTEESLEPVRHIPEIGNPLPGYYSRFVTNASILMNGRHCPQEVMSVNWEFSLIRTDLFNTLHGFDRQNFPHLFAIHDLCYRLRGTGRRNIFTPYAESNWRFPVEDTDQPEELTLLEKEKERFQRKWLSMLRDGDPFFNRGIVTDAGLPTGEFLLWLTGQPPPGPHRLDR